jgi:5-methylcytosine-specific restriction protein A
VTEATDVHHLIPKRDGGCDEESNLEALCHSCHSKVTNTGG